MEYIEVHYQSPLVRLLTYSRRTFFWFFRSISENHILVPLRLSSASNM